MPVCPKCRRSFPEGTQVCPEDEAALVEQLPYQTVKGADDSTWVEIVSPLDEDEARLLKGFLDAEGIPAELESLKFHMEPVNVGAMAEVRVYVRAEDEKRAIDLLRRRDTDFKALSEDEVSTDDGPAEIDDDSESVDDEGRA